MVSRLALCIGALFAEDVGILTPGGPAAGRGAVLAQAERDHAEYDRLQHNVSGVLVAFEGADRAEVRASRCRRACSAGATGSRPCAPRTAGSSPP